jgi:phospholipid transport system substrate-binding protein
MHRLIAVLLAAAAAALFVLPANATVRAKEPAQLIETVVAQVSEIVKTRTGADREVAMRQVLRDNFDLPYMASAALGSHWSQASEQQRARLLAVIETSEARAYGERLGNYSGVTVTVANVTSRSGGVSIVDSSLKLANGQSIKLEWEVHDGGQGPRIADVKAAGVSMFTTRRSDFNSYIASHGGTVEPLVRVLEARTAR